MIEGAKLVDPDVEVTQGASELTLLTKWNRGTQVHSFDKDGRKIYEGDSDGPKVGASTRHSKYKYDENGRLTFFDWSVTEGTYSKWGFGGPEKPEYHKRIEYEYEGDSLKYKEKYIIGQDLGHEAGQIGENTRI